MRQSMRKGMGYIERICGLADTIRSSEMTNHLGEFLDIEDSLSMFYAILVEARNRGKRLYIIGNGGSAGVAAHATTDFFNVGKIKASTLHESSLMTCMSNDHGYDSAFAKMLDQLVETRDILVAISSSGQSKNITSAVKASRKKGAYVFTLSGFDSTNPLRNLGNLNLWVNSNDYGLVEISHQFILHNIADRFPR